MVKRNQINKKSKIGIIICKILRGRLSGRQGMLISEKHQSTHLSWIFSFLNMRSWMIAQKKLTSEQQLMKEMTIGMFGGLMGQYCPLYLSRWNGTKEQIIYLHAMFWQIKNYWLEICRLWRIYYQETMISSQILGFYQLIQNHLRNNLIIKELKLSL